MLQKAKTFKPDKKAWLFIIIAEILLTGIFSLLHSRKMPAELNFSQEELVYDTGENGFYLDMSYDSQFIRTPEFVLPPGLYTAEMDYERSNAYAASLEVCYADGRYDDAVSGKIFPAGVTRTSCDFQVKYDERPAYLQGRLTGDAGETDYLLMDHVRIVPSSCNMRNFLFRIVTGFLLFDALLLFWYKRKSFLPDDETMQHFKLLLLLTAFSSIPLLVNYLLAGHDLPFHLTRIEGLKAGLESGMFPVRVQPNWLNGHGYAVSVFYCDLFLYLSAALRMFGVSLQASYQFYVLVVNTATVFIAYGCFSKMGSRRTGLVCTAVYSLNLYRLVCLYSRAAVGEYTAMVFLPLVIYGMWRIYTLPEASKEHAKSWPTLALGCSGVFLSHMITTEMTAFFILLTCIVLWKKTLRKNVFLTLVKAAAATAALSLWFLVPFLDYMFSGLYFADDSIVAYRLEERASFPAQLFMTEYDVTGSSTRALSGAAAEMPLTLGWASILVVIGWFCFCVGKNRNKSEKKTEHFVVFCILLSALMTTVLFPYSWITAKFPFLNQPISVVQYPWRFLTMAGAFCTLLLCLILRQDNISANARKIFTGLIVCTACIQSLSYMSRCLNESEIYTAYQSGNLSANDVMNGEYLPGDAEHQANPDDCIELLTYDSNSIRVDEWHRENYAVNVSAVNMADEPGQMEVPLLFAKGYRAVTDSGEQLAIAPGGTFRVSVSVPSGFTGSFQVKFQEPWYWRVCEFLSLLAFAGLIVYWRCGDRYYQKRA
ncbi:MAG: hypothetical protein NC341_00615 [Blautia sp.]|nr:hypothetical protein [Blautia sp.]MCM1200121.1 hypothetical protein [Bacteroides fragilis]